MSRARGNTTADKIPKRTQNQMRVTPHCPCLGCQSHTSQRSDPGAISKVVRQRPEANESRPAKHASRIRHVSLLHHSSSLQFATKDRPIPAYCYPPTYKHATKTQLFTTERGARRIRMETSNLRHTATRFKAHQGTNGHPSALSLSTTPLFSLVPSTLMFIHTGAQSAYTCTRLKRSLARRDPVAGFAIATSSQYTQS